MPIELLVKLQWRLELSRMLLGSGKLNFLNLGQLKDLVGEDFTDHLMLIN